MENNNFFEKLSDYNFDVSTLPGPTKVIGLTRSGSAWLEIEQLSPALMQYSDEHFQEMFNLHPSEKGKVMMRFGEVVSPRWHKSYLNTPKRNEGGKLSYMFCGENDEGINDPLPELFQPFHDFVNMKKRRNYNQVVANWYGSGDDYTPFHADYTTDMKDGYNIVGLTLNNPNAPPTAVRRTFTLKAKHIENDQMYHHVNIEQAHGCMVTMCGDTQDKFTHGVKKTNAEDVCDRINLSFRAFKE